MTDTTVPNTSLDMIPIGEFTEGTTTGTGVFDRLMQANKAHLDEQFASSRIRGAEYATVYLGMIDSTMKIAVEFFVQQRKLGLEAELLKIQRDIAEIQLEKTKVELEIARLSAEKIPAEIAVLKAQKCKLDAEYDVLIGQKLKVTAETSLMNQKVATEKAQTVGAGTDPDSVIGRQKSLYVAQADGFKRDAEQKATQILVSTWNARRTTDEGTEANATNKLYDPTLGRAVDKLLGGIGA